MLIESLIHEKFQCLLDVQCAKYGISSVQEGNLSGILGDIFES